MDEIGNFVGREEPDPLGRDLTSPPDSLLINDPLFSAKLNEPIPLEYAAHWTGELELGMAQHVDTMDMIRAREAYTRWLGSERTSNPDRRIWEEVLNRNPNVGIVKGEETLWGADAADFLSNNSDSITAGRNGIFFHPQKTRRNVKGFKKEIYDKYGSDINRCTGEVFDGDYAKHFGRKRREVVANSPSISLEFNSKELGKLTGSPAAMGSADARIGRSGTVLIASDYWRNPETSFEVLAHVYVHELGNVLSQRIALDAFAYGDPKGIGKTFQDTDTGARFEKCVFGDVDF